MSVPFDPYHAWLGIPPQDQPPNSYRLLGLPLFESDAEAIGHAADQRMAYLRTFQAGKYGKLSQKLLNEISNARIRLLNPEKKAAYDQQLRAEVATRMPPASPVPPTPSAVAPTVPASPAPVEESGFAHWLEEQRAPRKAVSRPQNTRAAEKQRLFIGVGATAAALLMLIVGWLIFSGGGGGSGATLVLDWPPAQRNGATLKLDGRTVEVPSSGPIELACSPGERRVVATRPGQKPVEHTVRIESGEQKKITIAWSPQVNLVLQWPREEREGADLEIDGKRQDIDAAVKRSPAGTVQFALPPGSHKISIGRLGFEPFERTVEVGDGIEETLKPVWKPMAMSAGPAQPVRPAPGELPTLPTPGPTLPSPQKPSTGEVAPTATAVDFSEEEAAAAEYAKAAAPAEARIALWDFGGAAKLLDDAASSNPAVTARLAGRRGEVAKMAALKRRIIEKINAANPRLTKLDLGIRGFNGEISGATEPSLTAELPSGKTETLRWSDLDPKAIQKLIALVVDRTKGDDLLAAGLLTLVPGPAETAAAYLDEAAKLGADIESHRVAQVEAVFARLKTAMNKRDFADAQKALAELDGRYAKNPWLQWNQKTLATTRTVLAAAAKEAEAEKVYAQAAELYRQREMTELGPLVETLRTKHAQSRAMLDGSRSPSFTELQQAAARAGKVYTVRQDGLGQFRTISEAIAVARADDVIEIQDEGPYYEPVVIPVDRAGLMLRGKQGLLPVITAKSPRPKLVAVDASRVTLCRLILVQPEADGTAECISQGTSGGLAIRQCILSGCGRSEVFCGQIDATVVYGGGTIRGPAEVRDSVWLGAAETAQNAHFDNCMFAFGFQTPVTLCDFRRVTVPMMLRIGDAGTTVEDSILFGVSAHAETKIERSNVFGKPGYGGDAKPGEGCIAKDPEFVDPANFDFHLKESSPCRKAASDGGDLGFRPTPEISALIKRAIALRKAAGK